MSILKNLAKAHAAVVLDNLQGNPPTLGKKLGNAAIKAIMKGMDSDEWKSYMALFADNKAQLDRLTVEEAGEDDYLPQFRAYIVSNSVCDAATDTRTGHRVNKDIDKGLENEAEDGTVEQFRPDGLKKIPDV